MWQALLLADIHGNLRAVKNLVRHEKKVEAIFVAGDIPATTPPLLILEHVLRTRRLSREEYALWVYGEARSRFRKHQEVASKKIFDLLRKISETIVVIPGNTECKEVYNEYVKLPGVIDAHGKILDLFPGVQVAGFGYSLPHVGSDGELDPKEFNRQLTELTLKIEAERSTGSTFILMTHEPPKFTNYQSIDGEILSGGSKAVSELIETTKPDLALFGHYHELPGIQKNVHGTNLMNPGSLAMYRYGKLVGQIMSPHLMQLPPPRFDFVNYVYSRRPDRRGGKMRLRK